MSFCRAWAPRRNAMSRLRQNNLGPLIPSLQQPVLGICLGMQLLFEASEEDAAECLGIIPGRASPFAGRSWACGAAHGMEYPEIERPNALLDGLRHGDYAYFVHSYALRPEPRDDRQQRLWMVFSACVQWRNFFGTQFHPERSAKVGARLLRNFLSAAMPST